MDGLKDAATTITEAVGLTNLSDGSDSTTAAPEQYDLIVVGSGFAGCMATLNFLEGCKAANKPGRVALIEIGKDGERCGASRWTMAYLRLDKDNNFDEDWIGEMRLVSEGLADETYCMKLQQEARHTADYLLDHGVKLVHHDEENVLLVSPWCVVACCLALVFSSCCRIAAPCAVKTSKNVQGSTDKPNHRSSRQVNTSCTPKAAATL